MDAPRPGSTLRLAAGACIAGKYRLLRRLGAGGMGQVWRARNETTGADLALKVLHEVHDASLDARFRNEAQLGAMLSHRSIVRIFDLIEEVDGTLVLVMELLRGESLAQYLRRRGPLSTREAVAIALPVLSALAHAHESGVVHRDVTPGNIFLAVDPDGQVIPKLVDFGIAKLPVAGSLTLDGRVLGSPRYMAPEQIRAASDIDGRSDLFSVAVTIYETIAGASPFEATTPAASLAAVLESVVDPDPRIEPRVWIEVQRALGKRPYERHRDATEMASALRDAVGDSDVALASLLRRDPWERDALDDAGEQDSPRRGSGADAHLVEGARRRSLAPRSIGLAVAVGVGGLLVLASVFRSAGGTGGAAPPASAHAQSEVLPIPAPSVVGPSVEATSASDSPMGSASSGGEEGRGRRSRLPAVPLPPMHPRPVATTPGF
jgi:serine/threonine-protein kinase